MAIALRDSLAKLPPMQWRGRKYQLTGLSFLRRWEVTPHQTLACQYPEFIGPTNWRFDCTVSCRDGLARKGMEGQGFNAILQLRDDCEKRARGDYVDPIWGTWKCVATEFRGDIDPTRRDGVDVQVSFLHKPELSDSDAQPTGGLQSVGQLATDAGALDREIQLAFYMREKPPPPSLVDPLSAIAGLGKQIERMGDKIAQSLHGFANRCQLLEDTIAELEDPETFGIRRALRRMRATVHVLLKRINNVGRDTRKMVVRYNKAVTSIAAQSGMTVPELLTLNPDICKTPMVPLGTVVTVYAR